MSVNVKKIKIKQFVSHCLSPPVPICAIFETAYVSPQWARAPEPVPIMPIGQSSLKSMAPPVLANNQNLEAANDPIPADCHHHVALYDDQLLFVLNLSELVNHGEN